MPSLKDMRNRIASVKATRKITKAMQMVAAAKLRKAQANAEAARPYALRLGTVMGSIAAALSRLEPAQRRQVDVLFVTTDPARDDGAERHLDSFGPGSPAAGPCPARRPSSFLTRAPAGRPTRSPSPSSPPS